MGSFPETRRHRAVRELNATAAQIEKAFTQAGVLDLPVGAYDKFQAYLELLLRWNQHLSLTAVREPDQIIQRHFVECAFVAERLPRDIADLLDYGSGAGLPGIPIAICRPEIRVTLAEAHGKKASFLREALRVLSLEGEVYDGRVETMPERQFDAVAMRAVEKMDLAIPLALQRVKRYLVLLTTERSDLARGKAVPGLEWLEPISIPNTKQMVLEIGRRD
jgi:16S rRNA (guanine527-N7)-methyltransferase